MSTVSAQNVYGAAPISLQGLDVETQLMAVQSERRDLLENQVQQQLASVAGKNAAMQQANEQIQTKRNEISTMETESVSLAANVEDLKTMKAQLETVLSRDGNGWTGLSWGWANDDAGSSHSMLDRVKAQGLTGTFNAADIDRNGTMDANGATLRSWISQIDAKISSSEAKITSNTANIKTANTDIDNLKSNIDALGNSQQMEMLRLQSLSNKCNEATDIMSNYTKKMQDNRSSIISNMR